MRDESDRTENKSRPLPALIPYAHPIFIASQMMACSNAITFGIETSMYSGEYGQ